MLRFTRLRILLRSVARDLAGAHDVFARDRTVRMNLLYVLGVTILGGVLNWLFRNTPAMPTGIYLVVALLFYPLLWSPVFVARHTQGRRLIEYGLGLHMKAFIGAAVTAIFLLAWPWFDNPVAKSLLEAYACTSEELLFRGFLIGELVRLFENSHRKSIWAAIVSSIIFAAAHTHLGLKLMILRTLKTSVFFGLIAVWTDSILLPIAIHCGTAGGKQSALLGAGVWLALCLYARANEVRDQRTSAG